MLPELSAEWLEADGAGGFASGTVGGARSRRYHALLLHAARPPSERYVLVNGFEAWLVTLRGRFALSTQRYVPDVVHPDGYRRLRAFRRDPWPTWTFECEDGSAVTLELCVSPLTRETALRFALQRPDPDARLELRLLLSGRDFHRLHAENPVFDFTPERNKDAIAFRPYAGVARVRIRASGAYRHDPVWYRNFEHTEERARGLDFREDLASPGVFEFSLREPAELTLAAADGPAPTRAGELFEREAARRAGYPSALDRAADAYVARRGVGATLIAGYPWFSDWGRDTFIALRGLCLARGRFDLARDILVEWASALSEGMLPNRFVDANEPPEYHSVDASLWYVIAAADFMAAVPRESERTLNLLRETILAILNGYEVGTRFGIRADDDGLLAAGVAGLQLTWMDAKVGGEVITPRIGKPVEVQALWLNALHVASRWSERWAVLFERASKAFSERFWCEEQSCLFDVIDVDHVRGQRDPSVRPNQIFAVGGLPLPILRGQRARAVVDKVERELLTPLGLRSLSPKDTRYRGRYEGGVRERDSAYHQGTVWPWLIGAFVEAWLRVHGAGPEQRRVARAAFVTPLLEHLESCGLGHVSEIADGDSPHTPRGAPFQAWSLGELLRTLRLLSTS